MEGDAVGLGVTPEPTPAVVRVRTNGDIHDVPWTGGLTVEAAARAGGLTVRMWTKLFVNGESARSSRVLNAGDTVTLSPRIING